MLQPVEVFPGARRSLRRAVHLDAELVASRWDDPRRHRVSDLSPDGVRLAAGTRLPVDEIVALAFTPPGWWLLGELTVFSRVARSEPRRGDTPAWMGLEFVDLPAGARQQLHRCLHGLPPPIPLSRVKPRAEHVWVDMLVTYTEELGDRLDTFEVSEVMEAVDDRELEVAPLAGLLTGGRSIAA